MFRKDNSISLGLLFGSLAWIASAGFRYEAFKFQLVILDSPEIKLTINEYFITICYFMTVCLISHRLSPVKVIDLIPKHSRTKKDKINSKIIAFGFYFILLNIFWLIGLVLRKIFM
jgi:hypothetical protein